MSSRSIGLNDALRAYLLEVSVREPEALRRLREETATRDEAGMQISPEQGQLMRMLVHLIGARRAIEELPTGVLRLEAPAVHRVVVSDGLRRLTEDLQRRLNAA